jgi:dUTP pyrophosphatase
MEVKFKKLSERAVIPSYATEGDAGLDISCVSSILNADHHYIEYFTGIAVEIPEGYVGLIFPRSSVSKKDLSLANCVGVIDSGYRGEITFRYRFESKTYYQKLRRYQDGDRIGQLIIMPYPKVTPVEVDELSVTERGEGGYGSTGS